MSRRELIEHLQQHGCVLHRQGGGHEIWRNPRTRTKAAVPRHRTIKKPLARGICRKLEVPLPPGL